jgi:protein-disulfide isomerase
VAFEEIDIWKTPEAIEVLQKLGVTATPALIIGKKLLVGFDPAGIDQAIASEANPT